MRDRTVEKPEPLDDDSVHEWPEPVERNQEPDGDTVGEITPDDDDGLPDGPARYRVPS